MPHPIVTALSEDAEGFIWVGTQGGLARWDGYRFRSYQPQAQSSVGLPDNFIQSLFTDRKGRLWIGSSGGGLARYLPQQDGFQSWGKAAPGRPGLSHVSVSALQDDAQDGLWIGTNDGLDYLQVESGIFHHIGKAGPGRRGLPDSQVHALLLQKDGSLLVGSAKGLSLLRPRLQQGVLSYDISVLKFPVPQGQSVSVHSLMQADDGAIWIGSSRHGVFLLQSGQIEALHQLIPEAVSVAQDFILSMVQARSGIVWLGTYGQGVVSVDLEHRAVRRIKRDPLLTRSLADDTIWSMLRSKAGFLWLGNQRGLQLHDAGQRAFLTMFGVSQRLDGISDPDVFSMLTMPDGKIWLGLGGNGIDILDPHEEKIHGVRPNPGGGKHGLPNYRVLSLQQQAPWVYAGTAQGLFRVHQNSLEVERVSANDEGGAIDVRAMLNYGGRLWLGGYQSGLWMRALDAAPETPAQRPPGSQQLSDHRITVLVPGGPGKIWIGTRNGLNLYDIASGSSQRFMPEAGNPQTLASGMILCVHPAADGRIWVGSMGGGISILTPHGNSYRIRNLGLDAGLPNLNVARIEADQFGKLWASTDNGLAMIDQQTLQVRSMQAAEGVPIPAYWVNSGTRSSTGELLFGGTGGLLIVRPQLYTDWQYQAPIVITEIRVMNKPVPALGHNQALRPGILQELVLHPGQRHLAIEFAALDYSAPERLRYMYRMEGFDSGWLETDSARRLASYSNLAPGEYKLHLRGSNRNGQFSEQELILPVRVLPAWYQSWWFRSIEAGAAALLLLSAFRFFTRYLRARARELEKQVSLRTAQLQEKQDLLQAANHDLNQANQELAQSAETLRQLGEMGRDITANLDAQQVFEALHEHVRHLLDATTLVIYNCDAGGQYLRRCYGREAGAVLPQIDIPLDSPTSNTARAVRERREILLERNVVDSQPGSGKRLAMLTSLFAPLIIDDVVLGVMAIQSETPQAYGERERMIFRTLCSYGAIALANAQTISALHAAQAQLVQQEKMAALGGLVNGVAHELNTPLGVVILALSGVQEAWREAAPQLPPSSSVLADGQSYLNLALHNAQRAAALVASFKAITADAESDRPDWLDLSLYLAEAAVLLQSEIQERGHTLQIKVEAGLQIETVAAALTEVLQHLLRNVLDHAFPQRRGGRVLLSAQAAPADMVEIRVVDNGCGIAPEWQAKVFDPFFTSGGAEHAGLGLHIAYNHVLQRLRGRIRIISQPDVEGCCVILLLPRKFDRTR
ncbi:two-component regulator propeller domain-containing protein [Massilia sp. W12]|uniref:sensor histidine kinase n=1 Tax=Massilia sp. W12 TaxID=3126507 RepID=UPI0030CAC2EA